MAQRESENAPDNYTGIANYRQRYLHRWTNGAGLLPSQIVIWVILMLVLLRILRATGALNPAFLLIGAYLLMRLVMRLDRQFTNHKSLEQWLKAMVDRRVRARLVVNHVRRRRRAAIAVRAAAHIRKEASDDDNGNV